MLGREEFRVGVDLDAEEGRPTKEGARGNKHTIFLKATKKIDFAKLQIFLEGKVSWGADCIDTINFLDHLMRQWPSQHYTQIKKSFFQRGEQRFDLGSGIEAFKGVFASLRPVLDDQARRGLSVNVDVSNGTFWRAQELTRAVASAFNCTPPQFSAMFKQAQKDWKNSQLRKDLRRFKKVGVTTTHTNPGTQWTIDEFVDMDVTQATFADPDNRDRQISVAQYFKKKYNKTLLPGVPVVRMTKKIRKEPVYLPIECLKSKFSAHLFELF